MNIIEELEKYRLENRITQEQLAEKLEVSFATVNRWFNGRTKPNKIQEYQIKKLLGKFGRKQTANWKRFWSNEKNKDKRYKYKEIKNI